MMKTMIGSMDDARLGHARLNECTDWQETAGLPLYERISAKIQKLVEESAEKGHIIAALGAEKDALQALKNASDHRCAAAEYRAQRIVLDKELLARAEQAEAKLAAMRADRDETQERLQRTSEQRDALLTAIDQHLPVEEVGYDTATGAFDYAANGRQNLRHWILSAAGLEKKEETR